MSLQSKPTVVETPCVGVLTFYVPVILRVEALVFLDLSDRHIYISSLNLRILMCTGTDI